MVTLIIQKLAGYMKNAQKNTTLSYRYKVDIDYKVAQLSTLNCYIIKSLVCNLTRKG